MNHITSFYKHLFWNSKTKKLNLRESLWDQNSQISTEMKTVMCAPFSEKEIKEVVFSMKSESAPGPNLNLHQAPIALGFNSLRPSRM